MQKKCEKSGVLLDHTRSALTAGSNSIVVLPPGCTLISSAWILKLFIL